MAPSENLLILSSCEAANVIIYFFRKNEIRFIIHHPLLGMFLSFWQSSVLQLKPWTLGSALPLSGAPVDGLEQVPFSLWASVSPSIEWELGSPAFFKSPPCPMLTSYAPVMVRKIQSFGKLTKILCLWDELQNLLLAGLQPGACLVYNEECFSPCKSHQCSVCLLRWEVGLVGMQEAAGTLTLLLEPLHLLSFEVVCLFNLSFALLPTPFYSYFCSRIWPSPFSVLGLPPG